MALDTYAKQMNPPSIVWGGGVHGDVCWLIAYYRLLHRPSIHWQHNVSRFLIKSGSIITTCEDFSPPPYTCNILFNFKYQNNNNNNNNNNNIYLKSNIHKSSVELCKITLFPYQMPYAIRLTNPLVSVVDKKDNHDTQRVLIL